MLTLSILAAGLLILLLFAGVSYAIASGFTRSERSPLEDHPENHGLAYRDVEFMSRVDGVLLKGWWISREGCGPAVVMVHGITGNRTNGNSLGLAARLHELGYNVLLFDQRGHGESEGERSTGGMLEQRDLGGAIDFLKTEGMSESAIGVYGSSMGAGTALLTLPGEQGIQAAVLVSPYASAADLIAVEIARRTILPEWFAPVFIPGASLLSRMLYDIDVSALTPERAAAELDYPVLVIHGADDPRVPFEHGRRVYEAAPEGSTLWSPEGMGHSDAFEIAPDEFVERVHAYFWPRLGGE